MLPETSKTFGKNALTGRMNARTRERVSFATVTAWATESATSGRAWGTQRRGQRPRSAKRRAPSPRTAPETADTLS